MLTLLLQGVASTEERGVLCSALNRKHANQHPMASPRRDLCTPPPREASISHVDHTRTRSGISQVERAPERRREREEEEGFGRGRRAGSGMMLKIE